MKNLIFIAPPAAGKGTLAGMLKEKYGYNHISTGDLFRAEVATGSTLGQELDKIMKSGAYVSDEITISLLKDVLAKLTSEDKFILDGYPRTVFQAEKLDEMLKELNLDDYIVLYLDIDKTMAMKRATGRIVCSKCNAIYHKYTESMKPQQEDICDKCGETLYQREDDSEETFYIRFDTYIEKTSDVIEYYKNKGVLTNIKVCEEKEDTLKAILEYIE